MIPLHSRRPYVGVTGFTQARQVQTATDCFRQTGMTSHALMCGFLMEPAMAGGKSWVSERCVPDVNGLISLFSVATEADAFPVVHYMMFECNDAFADDLLPILHALDTHGLPLAVQLNGTPAVNEVQKLLKEFSGLILVYQIRPELLARGPGGVCDEITGHGPGVFQHALIDPSCGTGQEFVPADVVPVHGELQKRMPGLELGFAGGFDGDNAGTRIHGIRKAIGFGDFSVDAEGKLFTGSLLDGNKIASYLRAAAAGFARDV